MQNQRSEEHTSELQSRSDLVCRLLLEKKNTSELQSRSDLVCRLLLEKKNMCELLSPSDIVFRLLRQERSRNSIDVDCVLRIHAILYTTSARELCSDL